MFTCEECKKELPDDIRAKFHRPRCIPCMKRRYAMAAHMMRVLEEEL